MATAQAAPADRSGVRGSATRRVFGLDCLRALAIAAVVLAHGSTVIYRQMPSWYSLIGHGGFYGVELFFVLSGFLIGQILIRDSAEIGRSSGLAVFWVRRWFRTLPLFVLFFALNLLLFTVVLEARYGTPELLQHAFFLRNFSGLHITFFLEAWSLAVEEWFYLLFPLALWVGMRFEKRFDRVFLCAAALFFLFSTIARVVSAAQPHAEWSSWQRMTVILRFDALMFGIAAAWIAEGFPTGWRKWRTPCLIAGAVLLTVIYASLWQKTEQGFVFGPDTYFARTFRFTFVSLGFALLLPFFSQWQLARETFGSHAVRSVALWSYALYLAHMPVFTLAARIAGADQQPTLSRAVALFVAQLAVAVAASALLYRSFERPITRLRERAAPAVARLLGDKPQKARGQRQPAHRIVP
jgi:peptidoglycan/LPS O-acetylase OafA/YrhL